MGPDWIRGGRVLRRRWLVEGRVQGVGFRAWTLRRARELGLRGVVRNRSDGTVDVEVEGPHDVVSRMLELLQKGPVLARVNYVREAVPGVDPLPMPFEAAL